MNLYMVQSDELRFNLSWPALAESDPSDETDYIFIGSLAWLIMPAQIRGTTFLIFIIISLLLLKNKV